MGRKNTWKATRTKWKRLICESSYSFIAYNFSHWKHAAWSFPGLGEMSRETYKVVTSNFNTEEQVNLHMTISELHCTPCGGFVHDVLSTIGHKVNNNRNGCGWAPHVYWHCILSSVQQGHSEHPQPLLSRSSLWPSVNTLCWNSVILLSCPLGLSAALSAVTKPSLAVFPTLSNVYWLHYPLALDSLVNRGLYE